MIQTDFEWPPPAQNVEAGVPHEEAGLGELLLQDRAAQYISVHPGDKKSDEAREKRINQLRQALIEAPTPHEQRQAWRDLVDEIRARSRDRVARMEAERGLR